MNAISNTECGLIHVWIDRFVPCLEDAATGNTVDTIVEEITNKNQLNSCSEENNWYVDWQSILKDNKVFALKVKNSDEIEGLIAVRNDRDANAAYITWACAAPRNNRQIVGDNLKYIGVGGHLFAVAVEMSMRYGYSGLVYGFAANRELLEHYQAVFNAVYVGILHEYHFYIDEADAQKIKEVYSYDWSE